MLYKIGGIDSLGYYAEDVATKIASVLSSGYFIKSVDDLYWVEGTWSDNKYALPPKSRCISPTELVGTCCLKAASFIAGLTTNALTNVEYSGTFADICVRLYDGFESHMKSPNALYKIKPVTESLIFFEYLKDLLFFVNCNELYVVSCPDSTPELVDWVVNRMRNLRDKQVTYSYVESHNTSLKLSGVYLAEPGYEIVPLYSPTLCTEIENINVLGSLSEVTYSRKSKDPQNNG